MPDRPFVISLMTFGIGFTLSIVLLLLSDPLCDSIQRKRLTLAAQTQANIVVSDLNERLQQIQAFADELIRHETLDAPMFAEQAERITAIEGVYSVEWHPRIEPTGRAAVEAAIQNDYGLPEPFAVMTYEQGKTMVLPMESVIYPVRFAAPADEVTKRRLGFHRVWTATRARATEKHRSAISERSRFYGGDRLRYGAWFVAGSATADDVPEAVVFATLDQLFSPKSLECDDVVLDIRDIGRVRPNLKGAKPEHAENELNTLSATHHSYVGWRRVGGRPFRFVARETPTAGFRPIWIPWLAFSLCNAIAVVLSTIVYQREAHSLRKSNERLEEHIQRTQATERQLQGTIDFRDQERELLAHEIHDTFVQDVIGAQMFVEGTLASLPDESPEREKISLVAQLLSKAIDEARRTIDYLKPRVVDEIGLIAAIETSAEDDLTKYGFETKIYYTGAFPRLPLLVERMLYRIVREAIANVRQHSGVNRAQLCMSLDDEKIQVEVTDQGKGFDVAAIDRDRFGILGIRYRVGILKGQMTLESSDYGTRLYIEIPADVEIPHPGRATENTSLSVSP